MRDARIGLHPTRALVGTSFLLVASLVDQGHSVRCRGEGTCVPLDPNRSRERERPPGLREED
jgi:hypothetical protein